MVTKYKGLTINHSGTDPPPLSYVTRENPYPKYDGEDYEDYYFEQLYINCATLSGVVYKTDTRKVHQVIHGFLQGETSET